MPIVAKEVVFTRHRSGGRAFLIYTLDDSRKKQFYIHVNSKVHADQQLIDLESRAMRKFVKDDVNEAVKEGLTTANKTATQDQVRWGWLSRGIRERESFRAYRFLKRIMPILGTNAQIAARFNVTERKVENLQARWTRLDNDKTIHEAYELLQAVDN